MGMIEVVQDAETVAKVNFNSCTCMCTRVLFIIFLKIQLHHGGSFSTLKDEPLYEWLKKKNPKY